MCYIYECTLTHVVPLFSHTTVNNQPSISGVCYIKSSQNSAVIMYPPIQSHAIYHVVKEATKQ